MAGFNIIGIHAIHLLVSKQRTLILNQTRAFFDGRNGEHTITVDRRQPSDIEVGHEVLQNDKVTIVADLE